MLTGSLKFDNVLFFSGAPPFREGDKDKLSSELKEKISSLINRHFSELKEKDGIAATQIKRIELRGSEITYYADDSVFSLRSFNLGKELSKQNLIFSRDLVGEKILEVSEKMQFGNLYLYSSGGGGHKSAKDAEMEKAFHQLMEGVSTELLNKGTLHIDVSVTDDDLLNRPGSIQDERLTDPAKFSEWCKEMGLVHDIDILHDFLGSVGVWASQQWDKAQQEGDVKKQESLASKQWLSDIFFGPIIFISTLRSLIQFKPKKIVSTQAQATASILMAIKLYNICFKPVGDPTVIMDLYMTDMPTEYAIHFFSSLKRVSRYGMNKLLHLHTPKAEKGVDWERLCGLSKNQIHELETSKLPVRFEFLRAAEDYRPQDHCRQVEIKVGESEELELLREVLKHQRGKEEVLGGSQVQGMHYLNYQMEVEDQATFLMLGSQPTKSATKEYVNAFLTLALENPEKKYHLFAFTGKFNGKEECFYKELASSIKNHREWPKNLCVVPLSYQNPKQLVSLEMECDTITRSGGATAMELDVLNEVTKKLQELPHRKRSIHAQQMEGRSLEDSIPLWEKGNYLYLKKKIGAQVIDPGMIRTGLWTK